MKKEIWLPIAGFEGLYEVSNWGRVASLNYHRTGKWHLLTPKRSSNGYLMVDLYRNKKATTVKVHRLVWETFNGEIPAELQVNHIDENKENNCLWNLNLMTCKQNNNWGTRNERQAKTRINSPKWSKPVIALDADRNVVCRFPSTAEAGRNGYCPSNVGNCCNGKQKTHKGLIWRWAT